MRALRPFWCWCAVSVALLVYFIKHHVTRGPHTMWCPIELMMFAMAIGISSLLTAWATLGATAWVFRLGGMVAGLGALELLLLPAMDMQGENEPLWLFELIIICNATILLVVLLGSRFVGLVLVHDSNDPPLNTPPVSVRGLRFSIRDLLIWIAAAASLAELGRLLPHNGLDTSDFWFVVFVGACCAPLSLAAIWFALGTALWALRLIVLLGILPIAELGVAPLGNLGIGWRLGPLWGDYMWFALLPTIQGAYVCVSLLLFRLSGYHIRRRATQPANSDAMRNERTQRRRPQVSGSSRIVSA